MRPKRVWPFEKADSTVTISLSLQNIVDWMGWISKLLFIIVWRTYAFFFSFSANNDHNSKNSGWLLHSWESNTSICTSSIILDWLFLIFQLPGRRWKISKTMVLSSIYPSRISFLELYSHFQWRSIGISNFGVKEVQILLDSAKIKPAVNQVR